MIYVGYEFLIWSADHWRKVGTREVPILNLGLFQSDWQSCFIYTDYGSRSGSLQRVPTGVESRRSWKRRFIFNNQTPNWCHRIFACLSELSVNDENALCAAGGRGREGWGVSVAGAVRILVPPSYTGCRRLCIRHPVWAPGL